jgi:hypothetical protein
MIAKCYSQFEGTSWFGWRWQISLHNIFTAFHRSYHDLLYPNDTRGDRLDATRIIANIIAVITSLERTRVWKIMEWK